MKFDEYILNCENDVKVVNEQGYQSSNVVEDFFKKLSTVLKGGADPKSVTIKLSDSKKLEELKNTMKPDYITASSAIQSGSNKIIENNRINLNVISANVYEIFYDSVLKGGSLETSLDNVVSSKPQITKTSGSGNSSKRTLTVDVEKTFQTSGITLNELENAVKQVLDKPLKSGIIKWEAPRELSPKDLFNRAVNKITQTAGQTAKELWSGGVTAGGNM